ncbi:hypothetical protein AB0E04_44790 [Streptomyces sp. NPDC048251]|uniref:hypothetical protein n=1 Tax=Streptomyces sp. NPDC048251 TaxID=3154501 RepID=UPI003432E374
MWLSSLRDHGADAVLPEQAPVLVVAAVGQHRVRALARPAHPARDGRALVAPHLVTVAADGGLDDAGVQSGEALKVAADCFRLDDPGALAGAGIEPVRQVLHEQRGQGGRRQHDAEGDAVHERKGDRHQDDGRNDDGGRPYGHRAETNPVCPSPGEPAQGQALGPSRDRG